MSCILAVIQSSVREAHLEHRMATSTNHIDKEFVHGIITVLMGNPNTNACPLFFVCPRFFQMPRCLRTFSGCDSGNSAGGSLLSSLAVAFSGAEASPCVKHSESKMMHIAISVFHLQFFQFLVIGRVVCAVCCNFTFLATFSVLCRDSDARRHTSTWALQTKNEFLYHIT